MSLRNFDLGVALLLGVQALVVGVLVHSASATPVLLPVAADFGGGIQLAEVNAGTAAVILLAYSAVIRALAARGRHERVLRWVEYSQVSGVTLFLVAQLNGIRDIAALVPIYAITAGVVLFIVLLERSTSLAPFSFGVMLGIVPWGVVAFYQIGASIVGDGPSALVRALTVGLLLVASAYWWFVRRAHVRADAVLAERSHIVLVLVNNSFFGWMLVLGVILPAAALAR